MHHHRVISVVSAEKLWNWPQVQEHNRNTGYMNKSDLIVNSYSISRWTWKWPMKLFVHLLGLTILNSFIILAPWFKIITPTILADTRRWRFLH